MLSRKVITSLYLVFIFCCLLGLFLLDGFYPYLLLKDVNPSLTGAEAESFNLTMRILKGILLYGCSIVAIIDVLFGFILLRRFRNGEVYSYRNASLLKKGAFLLLIGGILFSIGNIFFLIFYPFDYMQEIVFLLVGLCSIAFSLLLLLLSSFVKESTKLKKENDLTI